MEPRGLLPYTQEPHLSLWARSIQSVQLPSSQFTVLVFCCLLVIAADGFRA